MTKSTMSIGIASLGLIAHLAAPVSAVQANEDEFKVKGRIDVLKADGTRQTDEAGFAYASILTDEMISGMATEHPHPIRVVVIDGCFSLVVRKGERVQFDLLQLDHGQARPIENPTKDPRLFNFRSATFREPWPEEIVIRARYLPPVRVHFVDAEDRAELSGIDVVRPPEISTNDDRIYGETFAAALSAYPPPFRDDDVQQRNAPSPLNFQVDTESQHFPFFKWNERLWCHAPGHCWTPVDVDYEVEEDTTVAVARSGSLRVRLTGPVPAVSARLVLKPREPPSSPSDDASQTPPEGLADENEPSVFDWWPVSTEDESRFDGLPPESYRLELQAGLATGPRYLLGSVPVTIERGKESFVELEAKPVPKLTKPAAIPFTIDLHLDRGWTAEPFEISLELNSVTSWSQAEAVKIPSTRLHSSADAPERWTSDGLSLLPGTWDLKIDRFHLLRRFQVDKKTSSVSVDIGPPVDITFHLVDARSHEPVLVRSIDWHVPARDAAGERIFTDWPVAPTHHTLRARVPAGPIEIFGDNDEIDWSDPVVVNAAFSDREIDVPLKRRIGVRVRFTFNDSPIAWGKVFPGKPPPEFAELPSIFGSGFVYPDESAMTAVLKGPEPRQPSAAKLYDFSDQDTCFILPAPGTYVLTFRSPDRALPIDPREITIPNERVVEVVIPLQRKE